MGRSFTSSAYRVARGSATVRAVSRGTAGRRARNIAVGRALGKTGAWGRLWR